MRKRFLVGEVFISRFCFLGAHGVMAVHLFVSKRVNRQGTANRQDAKDAKDLIFGKLLRNAFMGFFLGAHGIMAVHLFV